MPCVKAKSKYTFCINSPHYNVLLQYVKKNKSIQEKIKNIKCTLLTTSMKFSQGTSAEDICKEFTLLYESFNDYSAIKNAPDKIFSFGDCDFLNYWLNDKLRKSVIDGDKIDVRGFYKEIRKKNQSKIFDNEDLENYMYNIDPYILNNMELLYDLYYYQRKILDMLLNEVSPEDMNTCLYYTKNCYEKYTTALNRCLHGHEEFYKALKDFKVGYNYSTREEIQDKNNCRNSNHFLLPEQDPVLEREQKKIMQIQGLSSFLMLILTFPLIYKFTPFGPFLQEKIKKVKNMWKSPKKNKEKLLSSPMDIGNNISDNVKYKLAYNSVTNE